MKDHADNNHCLCREFRVITKRRLRDRTRSSNEIEKAVHRGIVDWFRNRVSSKHTIFATNIILVRNFLIHCFI